MSCSCLWITPPRAALAALFCPHGCGSRASDNYGTGKVPKCHVFTVSFRITGQWNHLVFFSFLWLETEGQVTRVKYRPVSGEHRGNNRLTSADSLFSSLSGDDLCDNRVARRETVCRLLIHISNESGLIMRGPQAGEK